VSLAVRRGELLALVGESGSGKSTLARTLLWLVKPVAGAVHFEGQDLSTLDSKALRSIRRRMQWVPQDPFSSLNPRLSVRETIEEGMLIHGLEPLASARRDRVAMLMGRLGLSPDLMERNPQQLSGGQRQRVAIARALAVGPDLLIADEPMSALDVSAKAQLASLLLELQRDFGLTYVLLAHDLRMVQALATRVAVMHQGKIVEDAPTAQLFSAPSHPHTQALLSALPAVFRTRSGS
jgi:peptide/nickel transport system ATP-binding protein